MDEIAQRLSQTGWIWADKDPEALTLLESRIAATGRRRGLIPYSELAVGVTFRLPNLNHGQPYRIEVAGWTDLDRALIGEFLGYISARSYDRHGFMASALVVEKEEGMPSFQFFKWLQKLGAVPSTREEVVLPFWVDQVKRAHQYYGSARRPAGWA